MNNIWKKCSICKREIPFSTKYYECSVSTCTGKRTGLVFCSVACWDVHVPGARHRPNAGAISMMSPSLQQYECELQKEEQAKGHTDMQSGTKRIIVRQETDSEDVESDVLVVVSKIKKYIKDKADMNTSASVMDVLTNHIKTLCGKAIENARLDGRKTVLDRDVPKPGRTFQERL